MHFPRFMRRVNRAFTNPLMGTFAWLVPPLAVVRHVGRKSGRHYRSPVVAFRSHDGFVIPMTYGRDVDWARNMLKTRGCELERMGRRIPLRNPRVVGIEAASRHLPPAVRSAFKMANLPGYVLLDREEKARTAATAKRRSTSSRRKR